MSTALDEKTFDVLAFVANTAYPTETVTVYTDAETAHELAKIVQERKRFEKIAAKNPDAEVQPSTDVSEHEVALRQKLDASALQFTLRGLSPKALDELRDDLIPDNFDSLPEKEKQELSQKQTVTILTRCITEARSATGDVDRQWTVEKVEALFGYLNAGESLKLVEAMSKVNFNVGVFNDAVDAGFSR